MIAGQVRYNERVSVPQTLRTHAEVMRFFDGLEMVPPGLVSTYHPRDKAVIEAHQRYIRSSFFAGRSWPESSPRPVCSS